MTHRDSRQLDDVCVIDLSERFLRAGAPDGGAEAAEYVVHAREVRHLGQAVQCEDALLQSLVCRRQRAPGEDGHTLVFGILEQQVQDVAPDEPRRAGDERGAGHALSATGRGARP